MVLFTENLVKVAQLLEAVIRLGRAALVIGNGFRSAVKLILDL